MFGLTRRIVAPIVGLTAATAWRSSRPKVPRESAPKSKPSRSTFASPINGPRCLPRRRVFPPALWTCTEPEVRCRSARSTTGGGRRTGKRDCAIEAMSA